MKYNLSPETIEHPEMKGFLSTVLSSLLNLRIETKRLKKTNPDYAGIDSVLKWMRATCFGYTGYRNAKFGKIQVHERITGISRELLMQIKELAEDMGFKVLHGIVDCLWVIGEPISGFNSGLGHGYKLCSIQDMQLLPQPNLESLFQQRRWDVQDLDVQDLDDQAGREEIILAVAMVQAS